MPSKPVVVVVDLAPGQDDEVLAWRLESLLPDDWDTEIVQEYVPGPAAEQNSPQTAG